MFVFQVPGIGRVFVEASTEAEARRILSQRLPSLTSETQSPQEVIAGAQLVGTATAADLQAGDVFFQREGPGSTQETIDDIREAIGTGIGGVNPDTPGTGPLGPDGQPLPGGGSIPNPLNPGGSGVGSPPSGSVPPGELPVDVQNFPFASFQNALQSRGFNPEGPLGSTLNQAFNRLSPALTVGSRAGALAPIGEQAGALEAFFANRLPEASSIALDVFNDVRNRAAQGNPEASLFLSPDIGTQQGQNAFNQVRDLARAASQNRFGAFVANLFNPTNSSFSDRFERGLARGVAPDNFFDFSARQFGI